MFNIVTATGRRLVELHRLAVSTVYSGCNDQLDRRAYADATRDALREWAARLCRWLEIEAGTLLGDPQAAPEPLQVDVLHTAYNPGSGGLRVFEPMSQTIELGSIHVWHGAFDRRQWAHAAARAGEKVDPPLHHLYLHGARMALRRKDCRRAVVDAATACELALSSSIRSQRADLRSDDVESVLKSFNGLVGLYDYRDALARITTVSRRRLSFELASMRNDVVHRGREVCDAEVQIALRVAEDLISEVAPVLIDRAEAAEQRPGTST